MQVCQMLVNGCYLSMVVVDVVDFVVVVCRVKKVPEPQCLSTSREDCGRGAVSMRESVDMKLLRILLH